MDFTIDKMFAVLVCVMLLYMLVFSSLTGSFEFLRWFENYIALMLGYL